MYDVTIIGGGPSGSTLARLLGEKYKVLLIDRRDFSNQEADCPEKCCGGLIAPDAQSMLAEMGLGLPKEVLVGPQLFTVRTIDISNKIERFYKRDYINIDRGKFDSWLISLIPSSVELRSNCIFKDFVKTQEGIDVTLNINGKEIHERTKVLVGADGSSSKVRKCMRPNLEIRQYVSIQEWFAVNKDLPYYSAIFDDEITDFYSWTISKDGFLIVGSALKPQNCQIKFEILKKKLAGYGYILGDRVRRNGAFITRPRNLNDIFIGEDNVALIGEAAGFISPTSAEGLSYAFKSAIALYKSLDMGLENYFTKYNKYVGPLKTNILMKRFKSPFMYNNFLRKCILKSGLMSMNVKNI